ncbi:acyl carrier protein [Kitasatospora sp. NPDC002040]|uniref:acyl carrier protein n=1 Tax=Kitasatospora sp. NPDC002040 TaxID=3154661 RepID=UPI00331D7BF1
MSAPVLPVPPDRSVILDMLAAFGQTAVDSVPDIIGSLELTWLTAEFEQRYGVELELSDEQFDSIRTVDDAIAVLSEAVLTSPEFDPGATRS